MRFQFVLSEIGIGIRRNIAMTISVILVTFVSLSFVGAAALLQMQVNELKGYLFNQLQVTVQLCPQKSEKAQCVDGEVSEDQLAALREQLDAPTAQEFIASYTYESREDVFAKLQSAAASDKGSASIFDAVTVDDMQANFQITLKDPERYQIVADMFTGRPGVDEVSDQSSVFDPLIKLLNTLTLISLVVAGVMIIAATLLITTTIRLSALSRRRETGIMRLVGASNFFIQLPFMLEGAIAATIGALLAIAGLWTVTNYVVEGWLSEELSFITYIDTSAVWSIAPFLVVAAIMVAAVASLVSLRRYTKI